MSDDPVFDEMLKTYERLLLLEFMYIGSDGWKEKHSSQRHEARSDLVKYHNSVAKTLHRFQCKQEFVCSVCGYTFTGMSFIDIDTDVRYCEACAFAKGISNQDMQWVPVFCDPGMWELWYKGAVRASVEAGTPGTYFGGSAYSKLPAKSMRVAARVVAERIGFVYHGDHLL